MGCAVASGPARAPPSASPGGIGPVRAAADARRGPKPPVDPARGSRKDEPGPDVTKARPGEPERALVVSGGQPLRAATSDSSNT